MAIGVVRRRDDVGVAPPTLLDVAIEIEIERSRRGGPAGKWWHAERQETRGQHRLAPVQFVDALLRCGVGLAGVNLEIAVGYTDRGSASRDSLDFSRMLDVWSSLEIPLHITLAFPSSSNPDPQANSDIGIEATGWKSPWSEEAQAEWIDTYLPLLIAKQSVNGIYWTHLTDAAPHDFPNAGLIDAAGRPKKALQSLAEHSKSHWQ